MKVTPLAFVIIPKLRQKLFLPRLLNGLCRRTLILTALWFLVGNAGQAASIRYVGNVTNDKNTEVAQWQNSSVLKTFAVQGNNVYGANLAVNWNCGFVGQVAYGSTSYGWSYNDSNMVQGATPTSINGFGGNLTVPAGYQGSSFTFGLCGSATDFDGSKIRVGVMMDLFNGISDFNYTIRLLQVGGSGDSGNITLSGPSGKPSFYFFDLDNVVPQDMFRVEVKNASGTTEGTYLGPVTFDRVIRPPHPPLITPDGGYYKGTFTYSIHPVEPGVTVRYTTDGSAPTTTSPIFTEGSVATWGGASGAITIQAIAVDANNNSSPVATAYFNLSTAASVSIPVISPDGKNTSGAVSVYLSCATSGASIYYTTDGSVPTTNSTYYTGAFDVGSSGSVQTTIVRAIAAKSGLVNSGVVQADFTSGYTSTAAPPVVSPGSQSFSGWLNVTASTTDAAAVIRYTTDGTLPNSKSTQYTGPKFIGTSATLNFCSFVEGKAESDVTTMIYTATDTANVVNLNAADYNILPGNTADANQLGVYAAQWALKNNGGNSSAPKRIRLYFPLGTYKFNGGFYLAGMNNVVIDGQGSTMIFQCDGQTSTSFLIAAQGESAPAPNNCVIQNMTLQVAAPPLASGYVTAVTPNSFDLRLDPHQTAASVLAKASNSMGYIQYDPADMGNARGGLDICGAPWSATALGPNKVRINLNYGVTPGMYLSLRESFGNQMIYIFGGQGLVLRNIWICDGPQMGVVCSQPEDITLDRVSVIRSPARARPMTLAADGIHLGQVKGTLTIQDCTVQNQGDDGVNVSGAYFQVQSVSGTSMTIVQSTWVPNVAVGEMIEFRDTTTMLPKDKVVVTAVSTPNPQTNPATQVLTLSRPVSAASGDYVSSLTWLPRLSITRCSFSGNRARGTLIEVPNATVQNCRYYNLASAAVHLTTCGLPWNEASAPSGTRILNNSMEDCGRGAWWEANASILVNASYKTQAGDYEAPAGVMQNLTIADNTILNSDNCGIYLCSTSGADLSNNTIQNCSLSPVASLPYSGDCIYVKKSSNIRIASNTQVTSNYLRFTYDSTVTSAPVGGYNVQPFITQVISPAAHLLQFATSWNVQDAIPAGQTAFIHLCDGNGNIVKGLSPGSLPSPETWDNGERVVGSPVTQDLTSVPDGTYSLRVGLYQDASRLMLAGNNDEEWRVIVGTLVISGSGSSFAFQSQQYDIRPTVVCFEPTGPRSFNMRLAWETNDTLPAGYWTFGHFCDAVGNIVSGGGPIGLTPDTGTWAPATSVLGTLQPWTLPDSAAMPDGSYTVRVGVYSPLGPRLTLSGHNDTENRVIVGTLKLGTGTQRPISVDAATTSNVSLSGNTGF